MKKENKNEGKRNAHVSEVPDRMFRDVHIPESLAPTPINPALDDANQLNIPRNPGPALNGLDWAIPDEPLVTDPEVHPTPNPHTDPREKKKKK